MEGIVGYIIAIALILACLMGVIVFMFLIGFGHFCLTEWIDNRILNREAYYSMKKHAYKRWCLLETHGLIQDRIYYDRDLERFRFLRKWIL